MTKGQALRYTLLPEVLPRLRSLFGGGLMNIAWLLALIFASVRLLPREHPYLIESNMGRFGIRHVLAETSSRLVFSAKNIDQIIVYFTILTGTVLLCIQFGLLIAAILSQPVLAMSLNDIFGESPSGPAQDIAFVFLDKVFGVKGIFNSCISTAVPCLDMMGNPIPKSGSSYPYPMHIAFHTLLGYYALGIGVISLMVIIYQITTVVGETAATGTPFGKRYNRAWAPVRLILFFALLAPLNIGGTNAWLNGAQLATLWTAKWGSNVATKGWLYYSDNLATGYLGETAELIAQPKLPPLAYLTRFYMIVHSCKLAYENKQILPVNIGAYIIRSKDILGSGGANALDASKTEFDNALTFSNRGNITLRFGTEGTDSEGNPLSYTSFKSNVLPLCGEITLNIGDITQPGAYEISKIYYDLLRGYFDETTGGDYASMAQIIKYYAACNVDKNISENFNGCQAGYDDASYSSSYFATTSNDFVNAFMKGHVNEAFKTQLAKGGFELPKEIKRKGWAGAAIWYNTIAQMNGAMTAALLGTPVIIGYPEVMKKVEKFNRAQSENIDAAKRFDPGGMGEKEAGFKNGKEYEIARALNTAYTIFDNNNVDETPQTKRSGNVLIDAINMLFGTSGIYSILENKDINPLAQLSSLGRSMVEQAIRNFGSAIGVSLGEGLIGLITGREKLPGAKQINDFFEVISTIGILVGFVLFYVLPLMPFIYFFFALASWVKTIFEGIIAMPLWALAHLTIDGQGMSGPAASNGYFLLLEIFIRPILIFAGLVGSVSAFSMMVKGLNEVFHIVVINISGSASTKPPATPFTAEYYRGPVDEFFFTVLYTVLCYMIGLSCFKMIDSIPNNILRWAGVGASPFKDGARNPADQLTGSVFNSGQQTLSLAQQGLAGAGLTGGQYAALNPPFR